MPYKNPPMVKNMISSEINSRNVQPTTDQNAVHISIVVGKKAYVFDLEIVVYMDFGNKEMDQNL
jgi:hypothetical protein